METNGLTIIPPEGMEAYQEGNEIKFRPIKKQISYEDVVKKLFENKDVWRLEYSGINKFYKTPNWSYCTNCTSEKQTKKLLAINQLMNVAKYLNAKEKPKENRVMYHIKDNRGILTVDWTLPKEFNYGEIFFNSYGLAEQAIDILGEETIKTALSVDW